MIAIRDRRGRLWAGRLDIAAAIRLRDLVDVDVMAVALDSSVATAIIHDAGKVVDALYAILLPLAEHRGVSDRDFGRSLRGRLWGWHITPASLAMTLVDEIRAFHAAPKMLPGRGRSASRQVTPADLWGQVWRAAAVAGVDPRGMTLGELVALADAGSKVAWAHTATLLAMVYNVHRSSGPAATPADLDPTGGLGGERSQSLPVTRENLSLVARIFGAVGKR